MCDYCTPDGFDVPDAPTEEFYDSWAAEIDAELKAQAEAERATKLRASLVTVGQLIEALRVYSPDVPVAIQQGAIYCRYGGLTTNSHPSVGGAYVVVRAGDRI